MHLKRGIPFAILTLRPMSHAVRKDSFEPVEVRAHHINSLICHQPRKILTHALPHHARLAMMNRETFFQKYRRHAQRRLLDTSVEVLPAGKCQVVGVSRINRTCRLSKSA